MEKSQSKTNRIIFTFLDGENGLSSMEKRRMNMENKLKIRDSGETFTRNGEDFFLLIDTFWTALYNPNDAEWEAYLNYRKSQNYNAIQMNVILQWDGGVPETGLYPFELKENGNFDFQKLNTMYFDHVEKRLQKAFEMGFIPVLVLLHASYTVGTWAAANHPESVMPMEIIEDYIAYTVDRVKKYNPMYIVAGDTDLNSEETRQCFHLALETVKSRDPDGLTCFHLSPSSDLPEEFSSSPLLDFYMLQPGHRADKTALAYEMIQKYVRYPYKKPIVNGEFTYEGHSYTEELYGRYNEFDQRRGIWQSVLAGSKAGIGYGAQGLWGWYIQGKEFANEKYGGKAYPWQIAMQFKGAWEGSFARYLFEQYQMFDLIPCDLILNDHELQRKEIRAAKSADDRLIVIYMPHGVDIKVGCNLEGYSFTMIEMTNKWFGKPSISCESSYSVIRMPEFNSDFLFIGKKMKN